MCKRQYVYYEIKQIVQNSLTLNQATLFIAKFSPVEVRICDQKKDTLTIKPSSNVCANKGKWDIFKNHHNKLIIYNVNVK